MITDFISITNLQRKMKSVFASAKPMHVVLSNNAVSGLVFSKEAAELMMESGLLEQLREELWELHDKETLDLVRSSRKKKHSGSIEFSAFVKKYGL
jgi:hypothetical protein